MNTITVMILTLFMLYGAVIGSFLNVCIYRIPINISVAKGRSYCPSCNHTIYKRDLIPIVSYLMLKGKCRNCGSHISFRYTAVELLTAVLFGIAYLVLGLNLYTVLVCLMVSALIVVSFIDLDTGEIPDRFHIIIGTLAVVNLINVYITTYDIKSLIPFLIGFFAISVPMLIIAYFTGGFGGGDIKLMGVAGLFLGWQNVILAFLVGAMLGAVYGAFLLATKKAGAKATFSFGPHLCIGIYVSALWGTNIINAYLNTLF